MTSYVKRVGDLTDEDGFVDATQRKQALILLLIPLRSHRITLGTPASIASRQWSRCLEPKRTCPTCRHARSSTSGDRRDKNGIEDLKKARECIGNMIRAIEGDGDE